MRVPRTPGECFSGLPGLACEQSGARRRCRLRCWPPTTRRSPAGLTPRPFGRCRTTWSRPTRTIRRPPPTGPPGGDWPRGTVRSWPRPVTATRSPGRWRPRLSAACRARPGASTRCSAAPATSRRKTRGRNSARSWPRSPATSLPDHGGYLIHLDDKYHYGTVNAPCISGNPESDRRTIYPFAG